MIKKLIFAAAVSLVAAPAIAFYGIELPDLEVVPGLGGGGSGGALYLVESIRLVSVEPALPAALA